MLNYGKITIVMLSFLQSRLSRYSVALFYCPKFVIVKSPHKKILTHPPNMTHTPRNMVHGIKQHIWDHTMGGFISVYNVKISFQL